MSPDMVPAPLAARFLEPLTHPWTAATGALLSAGVGVDSQAVVVIRVGWRLLRLLLSL